MLENVQKDLNIAFGCVFEKLITDIYSNFLLKEFFLQYLVNGIELIKSLSRIYQDVQTFFIAI